MTGRLSTFRATFLRTPLTNRTSPYPSLKARESIAERQHGCRSAFFLCYKRIFKAIVCVIHFFVVILHWNCIQKKKIMEVGTVQAKAFSPFQIEMLELVSRVSSEVEMQDIRRILGQYFAKRAEDAIDRLWDEGVLNDEVIEGWKTEHMRTPYKK